MSPHQGWKYRTAFPNWGRTMQGRQQKRQDLLLWLTGQKKKAVGIRSRKKRKNCRRLLAKISRLILPARTRTGILQRFWQRNGRRSNPGHKGNEKHAGKIRG